MTQPQNLTELNAAIKDKSAFIDAVFSEVHNVVVGQDNLIEKLVLALLCEGHVLLEGLPGLAKTLTVKTLAHTIDCGFSRVQFTPDLLPSDLVGTMIFNSATHEFYPKKGPIFSNIVLADEINRAPAKVQSALLEAMGERQVTIGETTHTLESPFIVLATQNPIEQEGTYPLPEAQLDRFLFKVKVGYPALEDERKMLNLMTQNTPPKAKQVCHSKDILDARALCNSIYMDDKLKDYILNLVFASRFPDRYGIAEAKAWIQVGASPRATLALVKAARAHAFIKHRGYTTPEDVKSVAYDILRHRIQLTYEAEADGITSEVLVRKILDRVDVP